MMQLSPAEYAALLRQDFCSFVQRCFHELNPHAAFHMNWHIEVIAAKLDAVRRGEIKRLIINVPPRHLKSLCASIAFPAWCLGHNPSAQLLCVSYAQDLSDKLARDCRAVMTSEWYRKLFPARLSARKAAVQEFTTEAHGFRLATSVGGVLTGRGADIIVIDDPLKPEEALSESQRRAANEWFDHTLYSRLNDKQRGAIVLIMQRLHEDDLVGHVLEQEHWDVVRFPAIAEEAEEYAVETLARIRATLGEYHFASQYQQAPAPLGGGMVKSDWLRAYGLSERPDGFDQIVQSWDTANKASELSDFSVCTSWGIKGKHAYLLHVLRKRLGYPELKRAVREQQRLHGAKVVLIEDKASGTQLIQDLVREGLHEIKGYRPDCEKVIRLHAQTAMMENGFVHVPEKAPWLAEYVHELTMFPRGKHDDQVDSTSQFLDWFRGAAQEPGILAYYRELAAGRAFL